MDILTISVVLLSIIITSVFLANLLTSHLPDVDRRFDRKPFNCRPCCTFHLVWLFSALSAGILRSVELFGVGVVLAFLIFLIVKIIDNKKITK